MDKITVSPMGMAMQKNSKVYLVRILDIEFPVAI